MESSTIDPNVLKVLPSVARILRVAKHGESAWATSYRIDIKHADDSEESYFMKVSYGHHGREALKGEFEGTSAIYDITPDFCPKPIAWGSFRDEEDAHFYVCKFYSFENGVKPKPRPFCEKLSRLHSCHKSPGGKFGFHCATYNGDLPQDNTWSDSWETFFDRGLRHVLAVREERAGPNPELESLLPDLFDKVIPRLLRPLETQGRKIEPSLVHGDLWFGNAAVIDDGTGSPLVYDPAAFWAHNEYELGNWRERRNRFDDNYSREYYNIIEPSDPVEDLDDRNALYAVRFNLHAAALFPNDKTDFLRLAVDEIRRLVAKHPGGYTGE